MTARLKVNSLQLSGNSLVNSFRGFTLIELLVAITIVAILSTIGLVAFNSTQGAARDAKRKADLEDIKKGVYFVITNKGSWCLTYGCTWNSPANDGSFGMEGSQAIAMKVAFIDSKFLKKAAHDPKRPTDSSWPDYYLSIINDSTFRIYAKLENPPPATTLTGCDFTTYSNYNYCITE